MPKLWNETIEAHRRDVQDAVVATTARLVSAEGPLSVTMSRIAEETGIGRATLYKYFPDVESILLAWHDRQLAEHLRQLGDASRRLKDPEQRLEAVLSTYATILHQSHGHRNSELAAFLHGKERIAGAEQELHDMVRDLITESAAQRAIRDDIPPDELASYCLNALAAAGHASSKAAVGRLIAITFAGLRAER